MLNEVILSQNSYFVTAVNHITFKENNRGNNDKRTC